MCRVASAAVRVCGWQGVEGELEWCVGGYQELNCFCFHSSHCWTRLLKWPFTF